MEVDLYSLFTLISLPSWASQNTETHFYGPREPCHWNIEDKRQSSLLHPLATCCNFTFFIHKTPHFLWSIRNFMIFLSKDVEKCIIEALCTNIHLA